MSWNPLTFSSRKLHLSCDLPLHSCIAAVQSIVYLSCHRQSCLSQLHLFLACFCFPTQWQLHRLPKPRFPFRRPRTSQETQRPKSQSEAACLFFLLNPLQVLASWQIILYSARAPSTKFNEVSMRAVRNWRNLPKCLLHPASHRDTARGTG